MTGDVKVLIAPEPGTPGIPADVASTLFAVIGLAYPNARMGPGFGPFNGWALILSEEDREPRTKVGKRAAAKAFQPREAPEDDDTAIVGFDGQNLRVAAPEDVSRHLAGIGGLLLEKTEGATNYIELTARHPEFGDVVIIAARGTTQTPDALRKKADAERDALLNGIVALTEAAGEDGTVSVSQLRELLPDPTGGGEPRG